MTYLPFLGAFMESVGILLEKNVLRTKKIDYRNYSVYGFFSISILLGTFVYFVWRLDDGAFALSSILVF